MIIRVIGSANRKAASIEANLLIKIKMKLCIVIHEKDRLKAIQKLTATGSSLKLSFGLLLVSPQLSVLGQAFIIIIILRWSFIYTGW